MVKKIVTGFSLGCASLFLYSLIQLYLTYGLFDLWKQLYLSLMGCSASAVFLLSFYANRTKEWVTLSVLIFTLVCSLLDTSLLEKLWSFQAGLLYLLMGFSCAKIDLDTSKNYIKSLKKATCYILWLFCAVFFISGIIESSLLSVAFIQFIGFVGVLFFIYLNMINKAFR